MLRRLESVASGYGYSRLTAGSARGKLARISHRAVFHVRLSYVSGNACPAYGDLNAVLAGLADDAITARFREAWRKRVLEILADGGRQTVRVIDG